MYGIQRDIWYVGAVMGSLRFWGW